jgi:uncharacterized protein
MKARSVILPIVIVNIVFFLLQLFIKGFTDYFMLSYPEVISKPFIILTSMFLHGDFNHIFWNMYGLMMFGSLLEQRIGWKRFAILYFTAGILAGVGHVILSMFVYGGVPSALGASGAIMGMLGALIILMPDLRLLFFFFIPMSLRTAGVIWVLMDLFGVFVPSGVGNIAHLVGMATGLIYGLLMKREKKRYYKVFQHKGHLTIEDADEYMKSGRI